VSARAAAASAPACPASSIRRGRRTKLSCADRSLCTASILLRRAPSDQAERAAPIHCPIETVPLAGLDSRPGFGLRVESPVRYLTSREPSMKRRTFLKQAASAGAGIIAGASAPAFLGAEDKSGSKNPIVGKGEHRYECIHGFGELPDKLTWQTTHGVAVDAAGLIYIKHQGYGSTPLDTIVVFDPKGKFVRSFGKEYHQGGHGIDIRKDGGEEFL